MPLTVSVIASESRLCSHDLCQLRFPQDIRHISRQWVTHLAARSSHSQCSSFSALIVGLWARETGTNCLALIACLMFPRYVIFHSPAVDSSVIPRRHNSRLAFVTLRNNLMVLSLRAMIAQFAALMLIAAFCFGGFLYALWTYVSALSVPLRFVTSDLIVSSSFARDGAG